jgi:hypothetical protein
MCDNDSRMRTETLKVGIISKSSITWAAQPHLISIDARELFGLATSLYYIKSICTLGNYLYFACVVEKHGLRTERARRSHLAHLQYLELQHPR